MGGQINNRRGLAPAPFFFASYRVVFSLLRLPRRFENLAGGTSKTKSGLQKNERPVGVPAALAWGMEGLLVGSSTLFARGWFFHCPREQGTNLQEQDRDDHSAHFEENLTPDNACEFACLKAGSH